MINFLKGQPSLDLLPLEMFAQATTLAMADPDAREDMLQYANELGTPTFRNNLAAFLSREYGSAVSPSHLCPTSGASYGLEHAVALLTRPQTRTKYCYFQDPTYFLVFDIYRDLGFEPHQFVGIPDTKHQGLDVDHFEKTLQQHFPGVAPKSHDENGEWIYDAVLYCVPTHANPTGSTLPEDQRERLVQLAKKYNVLVICDDVYDILTFDKKDMPRRVVAYDLDEHDPHPVVISNGSFSKILAPGARSGWLECHPKLISVLGEWYETKKKDVVQGS
ncbi:pyridoxal phosphate-dependent transferase [Gongronella butleri]|nr:pyridoxal phosphate-dependent transferase [Gongronella butleri]